MSPRVERQFDEFVCFDKGLEPVVNRGLFPGLSLVAPKRLLDVHEIELRPVPLCRLTRDAEEAQDTRADEETSRQKREAPDRPENFTQ